MLHWSILAALSLIFLITLIYAYLTWHFGHWLKRQIPGPTPRPIFGNLPGSVTGKRNFIYDLDEIYRNYKNKSKFVGVFLARSPRLFILDPSLAKHILITKFSCFQENESSKWVNRKKEPIAGGNPFALPAAEWKIKRAEIVSGLTYSRIKGMYPIVEKACHQLREYITAAGVADTATFDVKDLAARFTGAVVAAVGWGIEASTFETAAPDARGLKQQSSFLHMSQLLITQNLHAIRYYFASSVFPLIRHLLHIRVFPEATDHYFLQLTDLAMQMRSSMESTLDCPPDLLQHFVKLQQSKHLTNAEVVAHMLTFHFDSFETSAAAISHCLLLLGRHPTVRAKLRQEINENINEAMGGALPFDVLMKLPYLEQCVAETLRLFPPLPFMSKICTQPCVLENNDGVRLQVQRGDICMISLHSFHHDEDYYAQPERFLPERFSAENGGTKKYGDMGVYLPFGDGPRICLGMKFALAQVKAAVVEVIKNFEVTVNERTRTDNWQGSGGFITGLDGGVHLNIHKI